MIFPTLAEAFWFDALWRAEAFILGNVVAIDIGPHLLKQIVGPGNFMQLTSVPEKLAVIQDVEVDDDSFA